jgi:hypothetical protein
VRVVISEAHHPAAAAGDQPTLPHGGWRTGFLGRAPERQSALRGRWRRLAVGRAGCPSPPGEVWRCRVRVGVNGDHRPAAAVGDQPPYRAVGGVCVDDGIEDEDEDETEGVWGSMSDLGRVEGAGCGQDCPRYCGGLRFFLWWGLR